MKLFITILSALLLVACASYSGSGLKPGEARLEDVMHLMGDPAMRWQDSGRLPATCLPSGNPHLHVAYRIGWQDATH